MALAAVTLLAPIPQAAAEWWHVQVYLRLQPALTGVSSAVPFALLDVLIVVAPLAVVTSWVRRLRRANRGAYARALLAGLAATTASAAALYLVFLGLWGLNYRRAGLEQRLDLDPARVTALSVERLAERALHELNRLHRPARHAGFPARADLVFDLGPDFADAQRALGMERLALPASPKPTLLGAYFRRASVAGMTDPFFLEVMITPDALPFERPAILAHEWAHLAGFANEADASFLGWLTCVRGESWAQYSGWFDLYPRALEGLPPETRRRLHVRLADGPRADYAAVLRRLAVASPALSAAAWAGYDRFLRANRVVEGVASYDRVVRLVAGATFDEGWRPRLRRNQQP